MNMLSNPKRVSRVKPKSPRRRSLHCEQLEIRRVLATGLFLQGTVFQDVNGNGLLNYGATPDSYQPSAVVSLFAADGTTLVDDAVTDAFGQYSFADLSPGDYFLRLTESGGYAGTGVQIASDLHPASATGTNEIKVTLSDPGDWQVTYNGNFTNSVPAGDQNPTRGVGLGWTIFGNDVGTSAAPRGAAQLVVHVSPPLAPATMVLTYCVDLFNNLASFTNGQTFDVTPSDLPSPPGLAANAGRIAYLYNTFGKSTLALGNGTSLPSQYAGLQTAIWELLYDAVPNVPGDYRNNVSPPSITNTVAANFHLRNLSGFPIANAVTNANFFLNDSVGKNELAMFLKPDTIPAVPTTTNSQGFIVSSSFNFAVRPYTDARILITPDATNEVNDPHTFVITVERALGTNFVPAAGQSVTVNLANSGTDAGQLIFQGTTDANGQFTVVTSSTAAGYIRASATATILVGAETLTRDTDPLTVDVPAGPGGSGPAIKTYVDASIELDPLTATNVVGDAHTYTATVLQNQGGGAGFVAAPLGTSVAFTVTDTKGTVTTVDDTVSITNAITDAAGKATISVNSAMATTLVINAGATFLVGDVSLTRDTDPLTSTGPGPNGTGPAEKIYIDPQIDIEKYVQRISPTATGEGLTPGFWKTHSEYGPAPLKGWPETGYDPDDRYETVFGVDVPGIPSLLEALSTSGGGTNALLRHSTAALLNAANPSIDYGYTSAQIISLTKAAILSGNNQQIETLKNLFDTLNNQGADLTPGNSIVTSTSGYGSDADTPSQAIIVNPGDQLEFTYVVTNPGTVSLSSIAVSSMLSGGGPIAVTPVLVGGFNTGDSSQDNQLDPGEQWLFVSTLVASGAGCNAGTVMGSYPDGTVTDTDPACWMTQQDPDIDIEKTTNGSTNSNPIAPTYDNEDADSGAGVPVLMAGSTVTWTYQVTNTGNLPFAAVEVIVRDDNGTPNNTADDFTPTRVLASDAGSDGILSPGEVWTYTASGTVQNLTGGPVGSAITFDFSGSSALNGTDGNIRTFNAGGVSVKASAFARDKSTGAWNTAWLGSYGGGLGVTDNIEGDGSNNTHTVDNVGKDNYVLLEFSESIVLDSAFLGYVVGDSDLKVWIGTKTDPFNNHSSLSDALLTSLGFTEVNLTDLTGARTADLNAGNVAGNVIVISADPGDATPDDRFKLETLKLRLTAAGVYENKGIVTVPGATDFDLSHYKNPVPVVVQGAIDIEKYVRELGISGGGEGLTPGYWKQSQHFSSWVGYATTASFNSVFGVSNPAAPTLLQALQTGGGGYNALGRHAVAALLNASNPNVNYAYTVAQIKAKVQYAYANPSQVETIKNQFVVENEKGADLTVGGGSTVDGPNIDADSAPGLIVQTGNLVAFTFVVTNPGPVGLKNILVLDDNQTPNNLSDDFSPSPVLVSSFNIGDLDRDNVLDVGEAWQYQAGPIAATAGLNTNVARVSGTPVAGGSTVTDSDPANWFGVTETDGVISGKKFRDATGNGASSDDTPLAGTVIYLDADNDGYRDGNESFTTTRADGSYEFVGLAPGNYIVREVVPAGFIRTSPANSDSFNVVLGTGAVVTGRDFTNYEKCDACTVTNVSYTIERNGSKFNVGDLRGNTNPGDTVTVNFVVGGTSPVELSLVTYAAPDAYFEASRASMQKIYEGQTGYFLPGNHSMTVSIPKANYQIDFVCGQIIDELGPVGSNVFYTPQDRLISADNDGNNTVTSEFKGVTLVVGGGSNGDTIDFNKSSDGSKISVLIGGQVVGQVSFGTGSGVTITDIYADGNGGADTISVHAAVALNAVLRGGTGNDRLNGGSRNDVLLGEDGDDKLYGYGGRDLLIGGAGKDTIYGNVDDDILVGGTTAWDNNLVALDYIMREWSRTDVGYSTRVSRIKSTSSDGLNGYYNLITDGTGRNVYDDSVQDILYGEDGNDWFIANCDADGGSVNDLVYKVSGEVVTDID